VIKRDGLNLQARLEEPIVAGSTLAILMHGFTTDMGYDETRIIPRLAAALLERGVATLRFDFNGHGRSAGRFQDMTVLNEIADAKEVLDDALTLNYQRIILIGHSQGGVVASMLAGYYPQRNAFRFVSIRVSVEILRRKHVGLFLACFHSLRSDLSDLHSLHNDLSGLIKVLLWVLF